MSDNGGIVTNRQLASELRSLRWEMRCLILVAVLAGNFIPAPSELIAYAASLL